MLALGVCFCCCQARPSSSRARGPLDRLLRPSCRKCGEKAIFGDMCGACTGTGAQIPWCSMISWGNKPFWRKRGCHVDKTDLTCFQHLLEYNLILNSFGMFWVRFSRILVRCSRCDEFGFALCVHRPVPGVSNREWFEVQLPKSNCSRRYNRAGPKKTWA